MNTKTKKRDSSLLEKEMPVLPLRKRKIEEPQRLLKAEELVLIPQIGGTCWFNTIFTIMLYSQMARKVMLQEVSSWTSGDKYEELKRNKFMRFLYYMLTYNYTQPQKIAELFEQRIKPELLILYFAEYYNYELLKNELLNNLITSINLFIFFSGYFSTILKFFFTNPYDILEIYYYQGNIFTINQTTKENLLTYVPKIIVLKNEKIFKFLQVQKFFRIAIDDVTTGIVDYEDEISFNGHRYKLDACTMTNYNLESNNVTHDICGITYDNQGYVYNGWFSYKNLLDVSSYLKFAKKTNCPLLPKDWKSDLRKPEYSAGFCLPSPQIANCTSLAPLSASDKYCFDFSAKTGTKTLIYVLIDERTQRTSSSQEQLLSSFVSLKGIVFSSKSLSPLLKTYLNLENKSLEELKTQLLKFYKNAQILIDDLSSYKTFYFILTGERLSDYQISHTKEEVLKKLFIALLKIFIKDEKFFKLIILTDDKIYGYLEKEQIIELAFRIGYDRDLIKAFMSSSIVFDDYLSLFYVVMNNLTNDKKEISMDATLIGLFIFHLCQYYLKDANANKFELKYYKDEIIVNNLLFKTIPDLKGFIKTNENKNLELLITKLKSMDDETAFQAFIAVPENQLLIETFLNENLIIKTLQERWFKELSLKGLLILITINQYSLMDLYNSQLPITGSGSFNKNKNNYKKVIKQLKNY